MKSDRVIYTMGAVGAILVIAGSLLDIIVSMILGVDLNALPKTAMERFSQIETSPLLGIYNLDFLNMITTLIMIPATLAICFANRKVLPAGAALALVISVIGTAVFISGNPSLPMLELSHKYSMAEPIQKNFLAAAGEAILSRGQHGSTGVFLSFVLPILASIIISIVMLKGRIFGKGGAWCGIIGNTLLLVYLFLVTFVPQTRSAVTAFATPGGILAMIWLGLSAKDLLTIENN